MVEEEEATTHPIKCFLGSRKCMKESFSEFYVKLTDMVSRRNEAESKA